MSKTRTTDRRYQAALERTIPAHAFSAEGIKREIERTVVDSTPAIPQPLPDEQFFAKKSTEDTQTTLSLVDTNPVPPRLITEREKNLHDGGSRLQILDQIAQGGTSRLYAVRDRSLGRTIALKILRSTGAMQPQVEDRFVHEARITASLEHPNIMPVYDIGVTRQDRVFFTMKNIAGVTLGDTIRCAGKGEEVPVEFSTHEGKVRILLKMCDALEFAHSRGFIHQDIKPDNIMLGEYGEVLLLDWGCAVPAGAAAENAEQHIYGTPAYMSPEQARREPSDYRSDIYCLCATLYHMLTLAHPTRASDADTFWEMKRAGTLSPVPPKARECVPAALVDIARRGMAPNPADRFQTVAELRNALLNYQIHADSIALAEEAVHVFEKTTTKDYELYAATVAELMQALKLWPENDNAAAALLAMRKQYAECALQRGDLELAASIAGKDPKLHGIHQRVSLARTARTLRVQHIRRIRIALMVLALALAASGLYFGVDYYRQFGKWQLVFHRDFARPDATREGIAFSASNLRENTHPPSETGKPFVLPTSYLMWLEHVRVRADVRVEVVARWPHTVDDLETLLKSRRENPERFYHVPTGYACQFGGWKGIMHCLSRNDNPRHMGTTDNVAANLVPGKIYRLWFEHHQERLTLYVNKRPVLKIADPLPMVGDSLDRIAIRAWKDVEIHSVRAWRMGSAAQPGPLVLGDGLVRIGHIEDAVREYIRIAEDLRGTAVEGRALLKAYLLGDQTIGADSVIDRSAIRRRLRQVFEGTRHWKTILEDDALTHWQAGDYDTAFILAQDILREHPDSRIALRMLDTRTPSLGQEYSMRLLTLLAHTSKIASLTLTGMNLEDLSPLRTLRLKSLDCSDNSITDLEPLRGMPLRLLNANNNRISSLEPLRGMPLVILDLGENEVKDVSPLQGMLLNDLSVMSDNYESGVTTIKNRGSTGVLGYLEPSTQRRLCGRGQASERTDEDVVGENPLEHGRDEERDVRRYGPQVPGFGPFAHSGSSPT